MKKTRVLALDLSTYVGWAIDASEPGAPPIMGTERIPPVADGEGYGLTFFRFRHWLSMAISVHQPALVAFEAPLLASGVAGHSTEMTGRLLIGLAAHCEEVCFAQNREVVEGNLQSVRKFFCGHGHAKKSAVLQRCYSLDWLPKDHNQADAAALWAYTRHEIGVGPDLGAPLLAGAS